MSFKMEVGIPTSFKVEVAILFSLGYVGGYPSPTGGGHPYIL